MSFKNFKNEIRWKNEILVFLFTYFKKVSIKSGVVFIKMNSQHEELMKPNKLIELLIQILFKFNSSHVFWHQDNHP